jgi:hypothetical protein
VRNISIFLSLLFVLSTCKKDEDTSILVNASVANSSEGSVDFKSGDYSIGSSVTFSATPKTGYVFSNWTNTSTNQTYTTNPLSITVNENTTLVANFEKAAYNVMFTISGDGSVQKEVVGGGAYTHGSQVKLTATPSDDYSFFYWNNDPGDTDNPKTITLDSNQNIPAKFDYEVARNLVGNWEFEISDPASKNVTVIRMSIDIFLNVLMTTIVNGEVISQIFTQMITISSTAIVIGDFAVITDVVVASATSLSMNMISIPEDTAPPTNESEIPDTGSELNLSGNTSDEQPETDEDGIIIPPTEAVTASSTTQDLGAIFEDSFDKLAGVQSSTLSSDTLDTGTATSTTGAVSDTSCSLDATLKSGSSDNQTVASGSSIDEIIYDIITDCSRVIHLVSSSGLPSGVSASITGDELKISGTTTGDTSGTFNYSIVIDNHLEQTSSAPFVSATVSKVVSGTISVINTGTTTTTINTGTTSSTASGGGGSSGTTSSTGGGGDTNTGTTTSTTTTNTTDTSTSTNTGTTSSTGGGGDNSGTTTSTTSTNTTDTSTSTNTGTTTSTTSSDTTNTGTTTSTTTTNTTDTTTSTNTGTTSSTGGGGDNSGTTTSTTTTNTTDTSTSTNTGATSSTFEVTLTSDKTNDTICEGDSVVFSATASLNDAPVEYEFSINGVLMTSLSASNVFTTASDQIIDQDFVEVRATYDGDIVSSHSILMSVNAPVMNLIQLNGLEQVCDGDVPGEILGNNINGTTTYIWQSSVDGLNWNDIPNNNSQNYQPPALTQTTQFRRITLNEQNGVTCESSVSISISVTPANQSPCSSLSSSTTSTETFAINVTASSASDYTLSGSDRNGNVTGNDPSVTIKVGDTIDFAVDASGHPFYLKTVQGTGTSDLVSGVTNNGATNGTVSWTPTAAGTYYYQCSLHNGMYGTITVN